MSGWWKALAIAGSALLGLLLMLMLAFGLAQTGPAKAWLAAALGSWLSDATDQVTITGITGVVPFDMAIGDIRVADARGPRIVLADAAIAVAPADLLRGRLVLNRVTARLIRIERGSEGGNADLGALLHPPLALSVRELRIERLELGPAVLGEAVAVTLAASGRLGGGQAAVDLDLHRIDGKAGETILHVALGGAPLRLELKGDIDEPSGRLLAELVDRHEPLPLALHFSGTGPLADWHGRLAATAGKEATLDADFRILGNDGYRFTAKGTARLAPLLPERLRPLLGRETSFSGAMDFADGAIALEELRVAAAAGTFTARGRAVSATGAIDGEATLDMPNLAASGGDSTGSVTAHLALGGTLLAPTAELVLAGNGLGFDGARAAQASATIALRAAGDPFAATTPLDMTASGRLSGVMPAFGALPAGFGETLDWRLALHLDRRAERIAVSEFVLSDAGATLTAQGGLDKTGIAGHAHLELDEIARLAGSALHGTLALDSDFRAAPDGTGKATVSGALRRAAADESMLDKLLGNRATLSASIERFADGTLSAGEVVMKGAGAKLTGESQRSPDGRLAADYRLDVPLLALLDARLAGSATLTGKLGGPPDALSGTADLVAADVGAGPLRLERVEARLELTGLAAPSGRITARFHTGALDGTAAAEAKLLSSASLQLNRLELSAAGTRLTGALTIGLRSPAIDGTISASAPDLSPWSALLGTAIDGRAEVTAKLGASKGQSVDLALDGKGLSWGAAAPASAERLQVKAHLADLFGKPTGQAELQLGKAKLANAELAQLRIAGETERPGRFAVSGEAQGAAGASFALATSGAATLEQGKLELRLTRLTGDLGGHELTLLQPLRLSYRGGDIAVADLALGLGGGRVTGAGSIKGSAPSLHLVGRGLPLHPLAALGGRDDIDGNLGFEATLGGTRERPQGELTLDGEQLRLTTNARDLPPLGVVASAVWRGDQATVQGRIAGPAGAALGFAGRVPFAPTPPFLPPTGALALHVEGDGDLANLAELLPLDAERLAGRFTVDIAVAGTVAAPVASGRLSLRDGRYESLTAGTILTGVSFDLVGDRDRLVLRSFTAGDGDRGTLALNGSVNLAAAAGPALDLGGEFRSFRVLRLDEASATASGEMRLGGSIAAPRLGAQLRVEPAELRVPDRLPQNVRAISVIEIDSASGTTLSTPDRRARQDGLTLTLDVAIDMPGQVFVRGRGLDSEWRGKLEITGTSAAPQITGRLEVVRGTYDFLGKSAKLTRGTIVFVGGSGTRIDPTVDIEAQLSSADVVAIVRITGTASQPKIALSSQPELPQDEILSRVLFGSSMSQISAAQGLEIAQAAASLATGGSLGGLDRVRQGLGLDRLSIGAAGSNPVLSTTAMPSLAANPGLPGSAPATGPGTSALPAGTTSGAVAGLGSSAVTIGKYVMSGVYVGVSQGITPGSSSVNVLLDVTRHIAITTTAGQANGVGIGVDLKADY